MKGLLVLLIVGVICSLSTGSYSYSKANKCRNECKRDEHCMYEGYVCEPTVCQGKKIKKCVRASVISKPNVMVPLTTGVIHGSVDPRDGIIPGEFIDVKTGGGHLVNRGVPPLNIDTGFQNFGISPVISSDVINVKPGSPQVLPVGPATGFNDADRIFLCVDNCVESSRCLGDKDCVLGCKQLCENGKSLINIRHGINTGLKSNIPHAAQMHPGGPMATHLPGSKVQRGDINIGMEIDRTHPLFGVDTGIIPFGAVDSTFPNKQIDILAKNNMKGHRGISPDQHVDIGAPFIFDPTVQITPTGMIDTSFSTGKFHQNKVDQPFIDTANNGYPKGDLSGKRDILNDQHMHIKSDLPIDAVGPVSRFAPIDTGFPVTNDPFNQGSPFIPIDPRLEAGSKFLPVDLSGKRDIINDQHMNIKSDLPINAVGPVSRFAPIDAGFPITNDPFNQGSPFIPIDPRMEAGSEFLPVDSVGHLTKNGQNGERFNPLFPVNSVEPNFPHGPVSVGGAMDFRPMLPLDTVGPVGHINSNIPVIDTRVGSNIDHPGHIQKPLISTSSKHQVLPSKGHADQCIGINDCPVGLMCVRRRGRNVCIKKRLGNNYQQ